MIDIRDKRNCCGCSACVQACPKQCISFNEDEQGFCYPLVDWESCIDCHLCEKVCPCINQEEQGEPLQVYAAINPDEKIRMNSSSGGIFTLLAEKVIKKGGVVFGARFDEKWEVVHDYTETIDGLELFRGSKYVQSRIGETYKQAQTFLKAGHKVLFSGTPCQIKALKLFLKKNYENLFTVDVACHGVPSPGIWKKYLEEELSTAQRAVDGGSTKFYSLNALSLINDIKFREKSNGWRKFRIVLSIAEPIGEGNKSSELSYTHYCNPYFNAYNYSLIIRPSCTECQSKHGKSGSDITIADFWGIENVAPQMDDNKGTSLIIANTKKGLNLLNMLSAKMLQCEYTDALRYNSGLRENTKFHPKSKVFFEKYQRRESIIKYMQSLLSVSFWERIKGFVKRKFEI